MQFKFLTTLALAAVAFAAPGDIPFSYVTKGLNNINDACVSFNKAIADWSGSYIGAMGIMNQSASVAKVITESAKPPTGADAHSSNTEQDAQAALDAAQKLATEVGATVDTAIAAKPKLDKIPVLGNKAAISMFESILAAAQALAKISVANALPVFKDQAQKIATDIENHLKRGIAAYQ